ncbi:phosphatidate cytidylyltransferase [Streptomyces sp. NBC_01320]|uniref:phosphatidate cytidylyltransferase n=1 Tax=Streptomyces sp. NBC_01320 TaxID=2903824 RepID=UPI002E0E70BC|nr:phosphatidate cytidylyltransferase [Streptomyces sp. NBC_01320]
MNDSSWGAPQGAGYGGTPEMRAAPAGPAYDVHDAQHTRPMPIVPDVPDAGRDADDRDDRNGGASGRRGVPPYRDEKPQEPMSTAPPPPQKKRAGRDLRAAIGVGVGLGAVIVASLFIVKAVFIGVIAIAVVVGLWELTSRLQERKGIKAPLVPLAIGGAAMVVAGYMRGAEGAWVAMALTALAVLVWRMTEPPEGYLRDVTAGVFAAFYVPFLATFVAMLLSAHDGPQRVLTFLLLTVVSDTGAYAVGWRFGKHKLAPRISPGKTREGLFGAVAFAMVAGALCMQFLIDDGTWWQGLLLGLAVAASATLGDLGESMIKRDLGIKDMGTLLPGHGGIMDRLDSLLPTAPVVWLLLVLFVGSG